MIQRIGMDFRTIIDINKSFPISHSDKIMLLGSCFSDNIGQCLACRGFDVCINPFGTLYNPASILQALSDLIDKEKFDEGEVFEYNGLWHSFRHHSKFSKQTKEEALNIINHKFAKAKEFLEETKVLIITFGTAFVYSNIETSEIVANCHKLPAKNFERYRLDVDQIVKEWGVFLSGFEEKFPGLKIIFTVSPIRHLADGAHGNQISKSTLLVAVDKLLECLSFTSYFPSYEIMMDELRDYRFYAADMKHPSDVAVQYIFERFSDTYFSKKTVEQARLAEKEWKRRQHIPLQQKFEL